MSHDLDIEPASTLELVMRSAPFAAKVSPRDEKAAERAILKLCRSYEFASTATMEVEADEDDDEPFKLVPTINLARALANLWGHIHYGGRILRANDEYEELEGWAFDAQACAVSVMPAPFSKLKKHPRGKTWKEPEPLAPETIVKERHALIGILKRRAILDLIPSRVTTRALEECARTLERHAQEKVERDPVAAARELEIAWGEHGVTRAELESKLGKSLESLTVKDDLRLWGWLRALREGASTVAKYFPRDEGPDPAREPDPDRRAGEPAEQRTTSPTPDGASWIPTPSAPGAALSEDFWNKAAESQST